ncbi:unnamed protein product [Didymodactylos carnosus]|uniref:Integrase catalytic domain-containing protein n=1 Tax=Didymodactylos carnosus TaxID=1234261 RepID=A0A814NIL7_9BILA|nr:unnamed protein product [Didymodactylos carnosus]CAF1316027.1 unnamed protein product [Didymodactylos carnosus]CAF3858885.1 unnamed protein product [Didymodactylos carnosus]CAF4124940.1 unnamed protein product [Didymodactylos carnosus]
MFNDIQRHVQQCPNCAVNKHSRRKPDSALKPLPPPRGVWVTLATDFLTITPSSKTGNKYVIIITDLLSKFVIAKPTRDETSITAAKFFVEEVILKYGAPIQRCTVVKSGFSI